MTVKTVKTTINSDGTRTVRPVPTMHTVTVEDTGNPFQRILDDRRGVEVNQTRTIKHTIAEWKGVIETMTELADDRRNPQDQRRTDRKLTRTTYTDDATGELVPNRRALAFRLNENFKRLRSRGLVNIQWLSLQFDCDPKSPYFAANFAEWQAISTCEQRFLDLDHHENGETADRRMTEATKAQRDQADDEAAHQITAGEMDDPRYVAAFESMEGPATVQ